MKQLEEMSQTVFHALQASTVHPMLVYMVYLVILVLHALRGQQILSFVQQDIIVHYLMSSYLVHLVIIALRDLLTLHYALRITTVKDLIVPVGLRVKEVQTGL